MNPADKIRRWREGSLPRHWEELTGQQRILTHAAGEFNKTGQILTPSYSVAASAGHFSPKVPKKGFSSSCWPCPGYWLRP